MGGIQYRKLGLLFLQVTLILLVTSCGEAFHSSPDSTLNENSEAGVVLPPTEDIDLNKPTYTKTVAKLFNRHCTACHKEGGQAPFPLTSYEMVKALSGSVKNSIVQRTMPPPGSDNTGNCQKFSNATWMPEEELQAIKEWFDSGMPKGDGDLKLVPPKGLDLTEPKTVLKMPAPYMPAPPDGTIDDYRCFIIDPAQATDTLITAIQVLPDKVQLVHHVIVFKPTTEQAQAQAEAKDGADGKPGFPCFGAAGVPSTIVGLWAPGGEAKELVDPDSGLYVGLPLEKGRKLIMQVHYNAASALAADQSSIAIKFNRNALPAKWMVMANFMLSLKPGQSDIVDEDTQGNRWWQTVDQIYTRGLADDYIHGGGLTSLLKGELLKLVLNQPAARDFKVFGVAPHMHTLGTTITVSKISAQKENTCMAHVPQFQFRWQGGYNFVRPMMINKDDKLKVSCHFNTTGRSDKVTFGEGTSDEMCLAFLLVAE